VSLPPPGLRIRPVIAADIEAILALWARVFPEYFDPAYPQRDPRASIERKLAFGDGRFWVAVVAEGGPGAAGPGAAERIAGTVMSGYDGHRGWIYSLGVDPALRRTGIASALAAHAEAELAAAGCPKVNLQVFEGNAAALAFWAARGFAVDGVLSLAKRLR
jgi:ribosomal protein S18 acetylase RimI-like enzyme